MATPDGQIRSYLEWSDRGRDALWRYVLGAVLMIFVFVFLASLGPIPLTLAVPGIRDTLVGANIVLLLSFVIPFFGIPAITALMHRRPFWSVGWPRPRFEGWNLFIGFLVGTVVGVLAILVASALGDLNLHWVGFDWSTWLPLAAIGTIGIFIQATTEEMLFRGYLTQFTRRLVKSPIVFLTVPSLLFAAPHISNVKALGGGPLVLIPYFASGLLYGWAAYRTGSLWLAIGLHWNNNLMGLLLLGTQGDVLKSVAPMQFEAPGLALTIVLTVAQAVVTVAILVPLIARRDKRAAASSRTAD